MIFFSFIELILDGVVISYQYISKKTVAVVVVSFCRIYSSCGSSDVVNFWSE